MYLKLGGGGGGGGGRTIHTAYTKAVAFQKTDYHEQKAV